MTIIPSTAAMTLEHNHSMLFKANTVPGYFFKMDSIN